MALLTFQQALKKAEAYPASRDDPRPHLLLGNGFSMAWSPKIFSYDNLLKQADLTGAFKALSPAVRKTFDVLETSDFEAVIKLLNSASQILEIYGHQETELLAKIQHDADALKNILAETIAKNHPENPSDISDSQYPACRKFLSNFRNVYTVNYDLLLYWTIMHGQLEASFKDGFEDPVAGTLDDGEEYYEESYVKWSIGNETTAEMFFMHGALHLYDAGFETRKFCWSRTGIRLKEQILAAMKQNMFPLFVAEGEYEEKFTRINHNSYLTRCYRSFQSQSGSLFVYGLGLKQNDHHICEAIMEGKYRALFVSVYGDENSKENKEIKERALYLAHMKETKEKHKESRSKRYKAKGLDVFFFDAQTARVWG